MSDIETPSTVLTESGLSTPQPPRSQRPVFKKVIFFVIAFALGMASGYLLWGYKNTASPAAASDTQVADLLQQINPPKGYTLPASYGDLGPRLIDAGAIDVQRFVQTYQQAGQPLTEEQVAILTEGSDAPIVINSENAYFLLNFFWAFGLTNQNTILTDGLMMENSNGEIGRFASTGGWTLATRPVTELYSQFQLVSLTSEQQARLEKVAEAIYRPCCNNPTHFPDCNHGMAMLGFLEVMAFQGASEVQMFEAAKYINAFWFPQQTLNIALFFKAQGEDFVDADARTVVGPDFSSSSGAQKVHQWLVNNGLLEQAPGGRNGCST